MTNEVQTYSTRSTASRGAKRALGHDNYGVFADENGRWYWEEITEGDEVEAEAIADTAEVVIEEKEEQFAPYPAPAPEMNLESLALATDLDSITYKDVAGTGYKSSIAKPVEFIHNFLDANPNFGRKAAVVHFVSLGINYSTARTQYQRWFAKR